MSAMRLLHERVLVLAQNHGDAVDSRQIGFRKAKRTLIKEGVLNGIQHSAGEIVIYIKFVG